MISKNGNHQYKPEALKAAEDLHYGPEVIKAIREAKPIVRLLELWQLLERAISNG